MYLHLTTIFTGVLLAREVLALPVPSRANQTPGFDAVKAPAGSVPDWDNKARLTRPRDLQFPEPAVKERGPPEFASTTTGDYEWSKKVKARNEEAGQGGYKSLKVIKRLAFELLEGVKSVRAGPKDCSDCGKKKEKRVARGPRDCASCMLLRMVRRFYGSTGSFTWKGQNVGEKTEDGKGGRKRGEDSEHGWGRKRGFITVDKKREADEEGEHDWGRKKRGFITVDKRNADEDTEQDWGRKRGFITVDKKDESYGATETDWHRKPRGFITVDKRDEAEVEGSNDWGRKKRGFITVDKREGADTDTEIIWDRKKRGFITVDKREEADTEGDIVWGRKKRGFITVDKRVGTEEEKRKESGWNADMQRANRRDAEPAAGKVDKWPAPIEDKWPRSKWPRSKYVESANSCDIAARDIEGRGEKKERGNRC